jgi:hypothetical protein
MVFYMTYVMPYTLQMTRENILIKVLLSFQTTEYAGVIQTIAGKISDEIN